MKLTTRCEYALLAMLTLTKNYKNDKFMPIKKISLLNDIPREFLEKIIADLSKADLIMTQYGSKGGVKLAKEPKAIPIADIIKKIDGSIAPVRCLNKENHTDSPLIRSKSLFVLFKRIFDIQDKILSNTTLDDLVLDVNI